jgi:hypothetical protein
MLKKIKFEMNKSAIQLANYLEVSPPTLYNWEKNKAWPLWALEKCGIMDNKDQKTIQRIKDMLDEY